MLFTLTYESVAERKLGAKEMDELLDTANIYMFSTEKIEKRDFPNWGMAYYPIDENNTNVQEFEQFKRNLLLLGDLIEPSNVTARLFWTRIKLLISSPQL